MDAGRYRFFLTFLKALVVATADGTLLAGRTTIALPPPPRHDSVATSCLPLGLSTSPATMPMYFGCPLDPTQHGLNVSPMPVSAAPYWSMNAGSASVALPLRWLA